jgi:hypothetical protein
MAKGTATVRGLKFVNRREPRTIEELSASERRQLRVAGELYDGVDLPARRRIDSEDEEECFGGFLTLWDVEVDGVHRYDAFVYAVDSGTVFRRGTTEVVAERIQFHFETRLTGEGLTRALEVAEKGRSRRSTKKKAAKKTGRG